MALKRKAHLLHAAHYERQLMRARERWLQRSQADGAALFDLDWPNILAAQAWAKAHLDVDPDAAVLCSELGEIAPFLIDLRLSPDEQMAWLETALRAARHNGDRAAEGRHNGNLGNAYAEAGRYAEARRSYIEHHQIVSELGDQHGAANALGNLGNMDFAVDDHDGALVHFEVALRMHLAQGDAASAATTHVNLGAVHSARENWPAAIDHLTQARDSLHALGDTRGEAICLGNLGRVHLANGSADQALACYEQRLALARRLANRRDEATALLQMAEAHDVLGDVAAAASARQRAAAVGGDGL